MNIDVSCLKRMQFDLKQRLQVALHFRCFVTFQINSKQTCCTKESSLNDFNNCTTTTTTNTNANTNTNININGSGSNIATPTFLVRYI